MQPPNIASKAFSDLGPIFQNYFAEYIRLLHKAREEYRALSLIFDSQDGGSTNKQSQSVNLDNIKAKSRRTLQSQPASSSSKAFPSSQISDATFSSLTPSSQKQSLTASQISDATFSNLIPSSQKQPLTAYNGFEPLQRVNSSYQPFEDLPPAVSTTANRIQVSQNVPASVWDLIRALDSSATSITKAVTDKEVKNAIMTKAEGTEDPRVNDILPGGTKTEMDQAKRILAQRSLAEEYRQWRLKIHDCDVIASLMHNPKARVKNGTGSIAEFLSFCLKDFQDRNLIRALQHGIKMLLLERRFEASIILAILNFQHTYFISVSQSDLKVLCQAVRESKWIMDLVSKLPDWLETCQTKYDEFRTLCRPSSFGQRQSGFTAKDRTTAATESTEFNPDNPDMAACVPPQHTTQISHDSIKDIKHTSQLRENSSMPYDAEWSRMAQIPHVPSKGYIDQGIYESYDQAYGNETWSTLFPGLLETEFNADYNAQASTFVPSLKYLGSIS